MAKAKDVLGLNARQKLFKSWNTPRSRAIANSKLWTKRVLERAGVSVPKLYGVFSSMDEVRDFEFEKIESSFVIKPSGGSAGRGLLIIKKAAKYAGEWIGVGGGKLTTGDLRLHISDILEGQYSTFGTKHKAFVEERVPIHPRFKRYVYRAAADVRVVVYNKVPVMAMLRLPTRESEGRANLHQGAIGVGVDIASGVTLKGVRKGRGIKYVPETKRKLNGIKIPEWTRVLKTAVEAAEATGLEYCGVDILMHGEKGPMVVELNSSPGLDIQLANNSGLKKRLERVEGLKITDVEHGVRVGKALFAEWFADRVKAKDGVLIVDTFEKVRVRGANKKWVDVNAKVDTGAFRSSIDRDLAQSLGLLDESNLLWESGFRSSFGREKRQVIEIRVRLKGRKIKTSASVAKRDKVRAKLLLGRVALQGFLVNPQLWPEWE